MKPVNFAVIGIGNIGRKHIKSLLSIDSISLEAVCDIDESKFEFCKKVNSNITFFTDYHLLLKEPDIDIITIATPHGLHAQMAMDAMEAGKHVIVEKPMALTVSECDRMNAVSQKTGKRLFIVKQNRFNKPILAVTKALDEKKLGKIYFVQCNVFWNRNEEYYSLSDWRGEKKLEGGALHTQVSHFIDLLVWWFGDIKQAKTLVDTVHHNIEIEDVGVSALQFNNGVLGSLAWTTNVYNKNFEGSITIIGEKGTIKIGGKYLNKIDYWDVKSYPQPENGEMDDLVNDYGSYFGTASNHDIMFHEIIAHFTQKRKGVVEGVEGEKTVQATELIYASI
jgi:UDP-N-acetyl-2-amino-2-deoxyglucuronate dehydrogenase